MLQPHEWQKSEGRNKGLMRRRRRLSHPRRTAKMRASLSTFPVEFIRQNPITKSPFCRRASLEATFWLSALIFASRFDTFPAAPACTLISAAQFAREINRQAIRAPQNN